MDDLHGRQVDTDEPAGTLFRESTRPQGKHGKFPTMRKTKHRGIAAVSADFMLNLIAYNLVRIPKLIAA